MFTKLNANRVESRKMLGNNLKILLKQEIKTVSQFSTIVGISTDSIYNYQSGKRKPDADILLQIKNKYREVTGKIINLDWLITGEGEMFISEKSKDEEFDKKVEQKVTEILKKHGLE